LFSCGPCDNFCYSGHTKNSDDDNDDSFMYLLNTASKDDAMGRTSLSVTKINNYTFNCC